MIQEIEDALVARLKCLFPTLAVEAFPDEPKNYNLLHPVGTILVIYRTDHFGAREGLGAVVQQRTLTFEVVFMARHLRRHQGAYPLIDKALQGLLGWRAPGCGRTYAAGGGFQHQGDGIWQYSQRFSMETTAMENTPINVAAFGLGEEMPNGAQAQDPEKPTLKKFTLAL